MAISRTEAASALTDIEQTTGRSRVLKGYQIAGPIVMVWGVVWILGYAAMGLSPAERWGAVWLVLDVIGVAATVWLSRRGRGAARVGQGWRIAVGVLAVMAFYVATFALFQPTSVAVGMAYPGLVTGLVYAGVGIVFMPRFLWIGAAVFVASLIGYFLLQPWLAFWMAAVGGGGLLLGGLWLRRA